MAKKQQIDFETRLRLTSPIARARWPRLNDPDTTYDENGVYKVTLELNTADPEHAALLTSMQEMLEEAKAEAEREHGAAYAKALAKSPNPMIPWKTSEDDPAIVLLNLKMKAKTKRKDGSVVERRVPLFDASGAPYTGTDWIRGGSTVRANFVLRPWLSALGFGLSASLNAVQAITVASRDAAEAYGFDAVKTEVDPTEGWDYDSAEA